MPTMQHRSAVTLSASVAALLGPGPSPAAHGAVIHSGVVNINIPSDSGGLFLNVATGQTGTSFPTAPSGWDINIFGTTTFELFSPTPSPGGGAYVGAGAFFTNQMVSFGSLVGPSSGFTNTGIVTARFDTPLQFNSPANGFGFRFINEATGQIHYGVLGFRLGSSAGAQPRTLIEYFWESQPGVELRLPSPGAATALLLVPAAAIRRRRQS